VVQAQLGTVLSNFISCATGITRLARPALLTGLLGAKQSEVQELTPLADLVVPPECRELVRAVLHRAVSANNARLAHLAGMTSCRSIWAWCGCHAI
jgi:hypothetical protein